MNYNALVIFIWYIIIFTDFALNAVFLIQMRPCLDMAAVYLDVVFELGGDGDDGCALGHRSLDELHYLLVLLQSLK